MMIASRYPPIQHPIAEPKTGLMTRPWVAWFQGVIPLTDAVQSGARAVQPDANKVARGTLYAVTDESIIEQSDGASWTLYR
jgi:hypothetical protein